MLNNKNIENEMKLEFVSKSSNEAFARLTVAAFAAQLDPTIEELADIKTALEYFDYFSVNVFTENTTNTKRDNNLIEWFISSVYPQIKNNPKIEILLNNTDLGVG